MAIALVVRGEVAADEPLPAASPGAPVSRAEVPASVFDGIGNDALAAKKAPGFVLAVVRDGTLTYAKGFGSADIERRIQVEKDTRFAIGSLTKQFTAVAVLLLAERGALALDDPLSKYFPAFPNASAITLQMLLNQTSGLHNYPKFDEHAWPASGTIDITTILSVLATDKPDFAPGTRWEYSNANYAVLSAIVAKVGGEGEGAFLQHAIFGPLGMTASGYGVEAQSRTATPYVGSTSFTPQPPISLDLYAGAGAVVSSAPDLALWDTALMNGRVLNESSMKMLWDAGRLADGTAIHYAMGFVPATLGGHREVWHNGLAPGAGGYCYNAIFPDDKLAVIVLSNGYDFQGIAENVTSRVLAAYDAPMEDPRITAIAKDWFHRLQTGTVDLSNVAPAFAQRLTPDFLTQIRDSLAGTGDPTDWVYLGSQALPGAVYYRYSIRWAGATHTWSVGLTPEGKIAGSRLQ
jgi:CubicO group peptidase (beta-lactamase class C family)